MYYMTCDMIYCILYAASQAGRQTADRLIILARLIVIIIIIMIVKSTGKYFDFNLICLDFRQTHDKSPAPKGSPPTPRGGLWL
jgi:hypothetical protein